MIEDIFCTPCGTPDAAPTTLAADKSELPLCSIASIKTTGRKAAKNMHSTECDYALTTSYRGSILQDNMIFTNNLPGIESTKPGPCGKQDLPSPTVPLLDLQPLNSRNQLFSKGKEQISPTSSAQKLFPSLQPSTACSELWLPTCSFHDTSYESRRQVAAVSNSLLEDISNLKRELEFGCASKKNQEQICMQTLDASLARLVQLTGKSRVPLPM